MFQHALRLGRILIPRFLLVSKPKPACVVPPPAISSTDSGMRQKSSTKRVKRPASGKYASNPLGHPHRDQDNRPVMHRPAPPTRSRGCAECCDGRLRYVSSVTIIANHSSACQFARVRGARFLLQSRTALSPQHGVCKPRRKHGPDQDEFHGKHESGRWHMAEQRYWVPLLIAGLHAKEVDVLQHVSNSSTHL